MSSPSRLLFLGWTFWTFFSVSSCTFTDLQRTLNHHETLLMKSARTLKAFYEMGCETTGPDCCGLLDRQDIFLCNTNETLPENLLDSAVDFSWTGVQQVVGIDEHFDDLAALCSR